MAHQKAPLGQRMETGRRKWPPSTKKRGHILQRLPAIMLAPGPSYNFGCKEHRSQAAQGQLRHIYIGTRWLRAGFSSSADRDVDRRPAPLSIFRKQSMQFCTEVGFRREKRVASRVSGLRRLYRHGSFSGCEACCPLRAWPNLTVHGTTLQCAVQLCCMALIHDVVLACPMRQDNPISGAHRLGNCFQAAPQLRCSGIASTHMQMLILFSDARRNVLKPAVDEQVCEQFVNVIAEAVLMACTFQSSRAVVAARQGSGTLAVIFAYKFKALMTAV